jgi:uncharacterized damage-inducible protein DinB
MSLGQLALHVATTPGGVSEMVRQSPFPVPEFTQPGATSTAELLPALEQSVTKAKENLRAIGDAGLGNVWRVVDGHRELMAMPVGAVLRFIMLNHWYHHRGQLSVYLRELGVPVPDHEARHRERLDQAQRRSRGKSFRNDVQDLQRAGACGIERGAARLGRD